MMVYHPIRSSLPMYIITLCVFVAAALSADSGRYALVRHVLNEAATIVVVVEGALHSLFTTVSVVRCLSDRRRPSWTNFGRVTWAFYSSNLSRASFFPLFVTAFVVVIHSLSFFSPPNGEGGVATVVECVVHEMADRYGSKEGFVFF